MWGGMGQPEERQAGAMSPVQATELGPGEGYKEGRDGLAGGGYTEGGQAIREGGGIDEFDAQY